MFLCHIAIDFFLSTLNTKNPKMSTSSPFFGPLVNASLLSSLSVGAHVRLVGKVAGVSSDGLFLRVMAADGKEIRCRLGQFERPSGSVLAVHVTGAVESDATTITLDSPVIELPGDLDLPLLNEALGLQFAKPFQHIFGTDSHEYAFRA